MTLEEAREHMANAMQAQTDAWRAYDKERAGLGSYQRLQQARAHTREMVDQFCRIRAQLNETIEEDPH